MSLSLKGHSQHLIGVFGKRNSELYNTLWVTICFLNISIGNLHRLMSRDGDKQMIEERIASVFARICAVEGYFARQPGSEWHLSEYMAFKYSSNGCCYCQQNPCSCPVDRSEPTFSPQHNKGQEDWSIQEWQDFLASMYGNINSTKGREAIINRLFTEVAELNDLIVRLHINPHELIDDVWRKKIGVELADTLAWLCAIATLLNISIEKVVEKRYANGCSTCRHAQCDCPL